MSIRGLDDQVREKLRRRAAQNGRSMEAEARSILVDAVREPPASQGFLDALIESFEGLGGVDLDLPPRHDRPRAADLSP